MGRVNWEVRRRRLAEYHRAVAEGAKLCPPLRLSFPHPSTVTPTVTPYHVTGVQEDDCESTQERLDRLDREHPFDLVGALDASLRSHPTGSQQESIAHDAVWEYGSTAECEDGEEGVEEE